MMRVIHLLIVGILMLVAGRLVHAQGLIVVDSAPARPGHFAFAPLEVKYHRVEVAIEDRVATTQVDQAFHNNSPQRLEGTFLFPLPAGATIDRFSMDIDGRMTEAELLDAARARKTYEDIVRQYRDPALLEYVGRGAMKVRAFPIEPRSDKRIQVRYTQVLKTDDSIMEYTYPLNTEKFSATPLKDLTIQLRLNSSTAIKSVYSPSHEITVRRDGSKALTVSFSAKDARPDTDFKLLVTRQPDPIGINVLTYRDGAGQGYFMLMASPGADSTGSIQPKDICFVLDTSGSMAGEKMDQAKRAMKFCLANLNANDRFEIVRFSTDTEPLFGKLEPVNEQNIARGNKFVDQLKPIGGTAIADALKTATELMNARNAETARPSSIIFITDGQPTVGEMREEAIVALINRSGSPATSTVRVFPFGIGTDINTTLLDRVANDTHAFSQYVLPAEDMELKVSQFYTKIQSPVLSNLKLESGDSSVRLTQVYPGALPDLFRGETLLAFGRYELSDASQDRKASIRLTGMLNGQPQTLTAEATFAANDITQGFIPRLWATRRVGWLLDEIRLRGESDEVKQEVTQLARQHGIVTPYTAYLILEDERRRDVPITLQTMRELGGDREAALRMRAVYDSAKGNSTGLQRAGYEGVANAQSVNDLKQSSTASPDIRQNDELMKLNPEQRRQFAAAKAENRYAGGRGGFGVGGGGTRGADAPLAAIAPTNAPTGYKEAQSYAQQVKVVNGRAFYQNGKTWTDNTAQTQQTLRKQEIKFNSDDYFALLTKYPAAIPWFSLGEELDVVLDETLYMIR